MSLKKAALGGAALVVTSIVSLTIGSPSASSGSQSSEGSKAEYRPIQSISYQFGSKSTHGYFMQQDGACFVVLMVGENSEPEAPQPMSPTRVRLVLNPGETAGLDSEEGRSLNFTCGEKAATLLVSEGSQDWLIELQKAMHLQTAAGPP